MFEIKSISIKVNNLAKEEYIQLMQSCQILYNEIVDWAFTNSTYNKSRFHHAVYSYFVERHPTIKTALQTSVRDMALEACKRNKLKGKIPEKKSFTVRLNPQCFTLRGHQLTLIGLNDRHKEILYIPDYYKEIFENWKYGGATLSYNKKKDQFWIHIAFKKENKIQPKSINTKVLGIDRGINNVVATSERLVVSSQRIIKKKNDYQCLRSRLQEKGTRSAKRLLRKISGKEKRFIKDTNHCISKKLVRSNYNVFVLENLKGIKGRGKDKGRKFRKKLNGWSYYQLQIFLEYKANAVGKHVVYVNPSYTSQTCSCCGNIDRNSRIEEQFTCTSCNHFDHADINAAINIKNRYLQQISALDVEPYVTNSRSSVASL